MTLRGRDLFHLGRQTFHWIDLKVFAPAPGREIDDPIASWLGHREFHDHYAGPPDGTVMEAPYLHGPYWAASVPAGAYRPLPPHEALMVVKRYCSRYEATSRTMDQLQGPVLTPIGSAGRTWMLDRLPTSAVHDWGFVLDDFVELVVLDGSGSDLRIVVLAGD